MSCGIYKIENQINGKIYIGQSVNIEERFKRHKSLKDNLVVHKALQKYGVDNFSFSIVELCEIVELDEKEKYWIHYYNSLIPKGYNMVDGGSNGAGLAKSRKVLQYDLQGNFLQEYDSARQAAALTGINNSSISACCRGEISHTKEYQWKYFDDNKKTIFPLEKVIINNFPILQFDKKGNFIKEYPSMKEAAEESGASKPVISKVCNHKGKTAGGYLWCFKNDVKRIEEIKNLSKK